MFLTLVFFFSSNAHRHQISLNSICYTLTDHTKELYRGYYIDPNAGCTAGSTLTEENISCGYTCNSQKYETMYEAIKPLIVRFVAEGAGDCDYLLISN